MKSNADESEGLFQNYSEYAKTLRTWLVAYGIGAPVLLLTEENISLKLSESGAGRIIAIYFLLGVATQIVSAFLNKWCSWIQYSDEIDGDRNPSLMTRFSDWWAEFPWIEICMDLGTIILFSVATVKVLFLFT